MHRGERVLTGFGDSCLPRWKAPIKLRGVLARLVSLLGVGLCDLEVSTAIWKDERMGGVNTYGLLGR